LKTPGATTNQRAVQATLITFTLLASWLGMQQVHELGHISAAMAIGAKIDLVALHPLTISHTDVGPNKHPLVVVWAGPLVGVLVPLAFWLAVSAARLTAAFLFRFFAGFCLVANGVYIGLGSFFAIGDCGEMLRNGSPIWSLWLFGVAATLAGFLLWNNQGGHFGFGTTRHPINHRLAVGVFLVFLALVALGLSTGGR